MQDIKTAWGTDPEFGTMGRSSALPGGLGDGGLLAAAAEAAAAEAAANAKAKDDNQDETKTDKKSKKEKKDKKKDKKKKGGQGTFIAVKPWLHTIESTVPSKPPPMDSSTPDTRLDLDWVYGYSSTHQRNNVHYAASGELIYPAGA